MKQGYVTCIKHAASVSENLYCILLNENSPALLWLKSTVILHLGDKIEFEQDTDTITSAIIDDKNSGSKLCLQIARQGAKTLMKEFAPSQKEEMDQITKRMHKRLCEVSTKLLEGILLGSPLIVRFHNDADGATGGYGLYLALQELFAKVCAGTAPKVFWKMQRGVAYTFGDAREDILSIGNYDSFSKPILLITDFGTTSESLEGTRLGLEKFEIIWLDHHPILQELVDLVPNYINPWQFGADSNYTAGFLTCEFGKTFAKPNVELLQSASLVGDYSSYAEDDEPGKDLALLLDMLTSDKRIAIASGPNDLTPYEIDQILSDQKRSSDLIGYAKNRLEEALDSGIEGIKKYKGLNASVYLLDFDNVRKDNNTKYPLPGRYASKLLDRIEDETNSPAILVLHFGHFISIRISTKVSDQINLLALLSHLKQGYSYIDAAGGHSNAASIKLKSDEMKKELLNALLRGLGCNVI